MRGRSWCLRMWNGLTSRKVNIGLLLFALVLALRARVFGAEFLIRRVHCFLNLALHLRPRPILLFAISVPKVIFFALNIFFVVS